MSDFLAEQERLEQHLKKALEQLQEEGDNDPSSKNGVIAHNQVLGELRHFKLGGQEALDRFWDEVRRSGDEEKSDPEGWWVRGFIVRTRMDGIHTRLDVGDMFRRVRYIEQQSQQLRRKVDWILLLGALCAVMLAVHLFR